MKYAVISDVHANYPALKAVLSDVPSNVDGILFLGDLVGLMGYPYKTAKSLMKSTDHGLKGNHDIAVLEHGEGHVNSSELSDFELNLTVDNITQKQKEWITSNPTYKEIPEDGIVMSHAQPTPELSSGIEVRNFGLKKGSYTKAASNFDTEVYDFILVGHTHDQSKLDCSKFGHDITVLNPGSVGQSIDEPAEYAIINTDDNTAELKSVEFDSESVKQHLKSIGVPKKWW